jgi:hypothetical protein
MGPGLKISPCIQTPSKYIESNPIAGLDVLGLTDGWLLYYQEQKKFWVLSSNIAGIHDCIAPGWLRFFQIADEVNTFFAVLSQEFSFESWKGSRVVGKTTGSWERANAKTLNKKKVLGGKVGRLARESVLFLRIQQRDKLYISWGPPNSHSTNMSRPL